MAVIWLHLCSKAPLAVSHMDGVKLRDHLSVRLRWPGRCLLDGAQANNIFAHLDASVQHAAMMHPGHLVCSYTELRTLMTQVRYGRALRSAALTVRGTGAPGMATRPRAASSSTTLASASGLWDSWNLAGHASPQDCGCLEVWRLVHSARLQAAGVGGALSGVTDAE